MNKILRFGAFVLIVCLLCSLWGCTVPVASEFSLDMVPAYSGKPYAEINQNIPFFTEEEIRDASFERYSPLDFLGRCGTCVASIGWDIMPTEDRESISSVKPSGWENVKYDGIDGEYLYNRCHLIGFQLTGENANEKNLITGTRYLNTEGMLPFENKVADYVTDTGNHVMYRVTPIFEGSNLVASGVLMEAYSVEDKGDGIHFCVYCYNVQPGISINYQDGTSSRDGIASAVQTAASRTEYVLNTKSKKFHESSCGGAADIHEKNKSVSNLSREELLAQGYSPCGNCKP